MLVSIEKDTLTKDGLYAVVQSVTVDDLELVECYRLGFPEQLVAFQANFIVTGENK